MTCRRVLLGGMVALMVMAGCSGQAASRYHKHGALKVLPWSGDVTFNNGAVGLRYGYALPRLRNTADHPITIDSFTIESVDPRLRVIRFLAYSAKKHGFALASHLAAGPAYQDFSRWRNLFHPHETTLPPHSTAGLVFAAVIEVERIGTSDMYASHCGVLYHYGRTHLSQAIPCLFGVAPPSA